MTVAQRFGRQALIAGWNQGALAAATLTLVGHNTFTEYLALSASALGIGTVRLISTRDESGPEAGLLRLSDAPSRGGRLEEMVGRVGESALDFVDAGMRAPGDGLYLSGSSAIVEATGRAASRALALHYALINQTPCELVHFGPGGFTFTNVQENPLPLLSQPWQGFDQVAAMTAAGAALEEIKKGLFKSNGSRTPLACACPSQRHPNETYADARVLLVGAGALGNFVAPGLAMLGVPRVDIVDPDIIDETNLNRQLLFYHAVGQHKALVLAARSAALAPEDCRYRPRPVAFGPRSRLKPYTAVFDCVDNFETRLLLSKKCVEAGVPLLSGGTGPAAGQAIAYAPHTTSCPAHVLGLEAIAQQRQAERTGPEAGCLAAPDPSVIMTNQAVAGLMLMAYRRLTHPHLFGPPLNGQSRYDAAGPTRFGSIPLSAPCGD